MDLSRILLDIVIVLAAAKLAAEGAERIGIPAVVGEILAGILIGPSVLGMVGREDEVLRVLGELGVILLLLEVGMEMDLPELRKVGRASLSVATLGVVAPMLVGIGAMRLMGESGNTALFVGAALTATSVGITARVFGDLRALATSEARIVLGAAVADDVMGLVVLTVVVRLVTEGSVSALSVAGIIAVALGFLVVGGAAALRAAPVVFGHINRIARSSGTLVALAFAFTLGFAELAGQAKLAPIVGAFLAGLALGRTDVSERIRGELAPVGHLFIPVFFLQIGIDADVGAFGRATVLRDAGILQVVANVGKLVAALGASRASGDRILIGIGMMPRGEVGLIFATIGLANGVLDENLYAALLVVVLATTLITPPLLKQRSRLVLRRARDAARASASGIEVAPIPVVAGGEVRLPGPVDDDAGLLLALRAALLCRDAPPSSDLVAWLGGLADDAAPGWSREERDLFVDVVERGHARSWRFLEATGTLDRALPELAAALRRRRGDPLDLDVDAAYRWRALERLRVLDTGDPAVQEARLLDHPVRLLVAALLVEALDQEPRPAETARRIADRIGLAPDDRDEVAALVEDRHLLWAASRRSGALDEAAVRQLAAHLRTPDRARAAFVLAALRDTGHERWERARLTQLHELVQDTLGRRSGDTAQVDLVEHRRGEVVELVGDAPAAVARAVGASDAFLLAAAAPDVARHLRALDPVPRRGQVRVEVEGGAEEAPWTVTVVARDRAGMLAASAAALVAADLDVTGALAATWADGAAIELFEVAGSRRPDPARVAAAVEAALDEPLAVAPLIDVTFTFDHRASPWHSVCEVDGPERRGLLADVAAVLHAAGVTIRAARVAGADGRAHDTLEVTTVSGAKVDAATEQRVRELAARGVTVRKRAFRAPVLVAGPT
jgi:Kef-type K+ transport system membrane component KefB